MDQDAGALFGSVARDDSAPGSDVDVLVDFRDDASLYDLSALWQELQDLLGCTVDVVEALLANLPDEEADDQD